MCPGDLQDMEDDFVMLESTTLPSRDKTSDGPLAPDSVSVTLDLQNISPQSNELLISIRPPKEPETIIKHVPCDIVLVIDVSGSMNAVAELPDTAGEDVKESSGLSILDLVKHASRTILENLNENDRLAVVTFSTQAKVIQGLERMTDIQKQESWSRIEALNVQNSTNLWAGMREGLDIFTKTDSIGNVQGMYILTDGVPNHMNPAQGFCKKLQPILKTLETEKGQAPIVSTFGFGYSLRSGLLRSIAEVGRGTFSFIPDAGMIGTVFVHAVANLFSTFATNVELVLQCANPDAAFQTPAYLEFGTERLNDRTVLHLGNLQYGQSRDIIVKVHNPSPTNDGLEATLRYQVPHKGRNAVTVSHSFKSRATVSQKVRDYHISRHDLLHFLASLSTKSQTNEHVPHSITYIVGFQPALKALISTIENRLVSASPDTDKAEVLSLLADLKSTDPTNPHGAGQISLALNTTIPTATPPGEVQPTSTSQASNIATTRSQLQYTNTNINTAPQLPQRFASSHHNHRSVQQPFYTRWGQHYLPSILHAHALQLCTTFKDPGPLRYGLNSPLFQRCRDELDEAFDRLPAPTPSLSSSSRSSSSHGSSSAGGTPVMMRRYNRSSNPCFAGSCEVRCIDGLDLRVDEVRVGDVLWTKAGGRMVQGVLKTEIQDQQELCHIPRQDGRTIGASGVETEGQLWITPWHPVFVDGRWSFPADVALASQTKTLERGDSVYSFILEKDGDSNAHAIEVGGVVCVTLGHGLVTDPGDSAHGEHGDDVRIHPYFGDYEAIIKDLEVLEKDDCGRRVCAGVVKRVWRDIDGETGKVLACGFVRSGNRDITDRNMFEVEEERNEKKEAEEMVKARL